MINTPLIHLKCPKSIFQTIMLFGLFPSRQVGRHCTVTSSQQGDAEYLPTRRQFNPGN